MKVKRVFNNNVVLAYNNDSEVVLFGKGIGFQKQHGDPIDKNKIEKLFALDEKEKSNIEELFSTISKEYSDLTFKIVKQAESDLKIEFNSNIYIAIMDHINYALSRAAQGLFITNPLKWEIKRTYPAEYQSALKTLEIIKHETQIELPEDEAGTIAIHFFNAQDPTRLMNTSLKSVGIIQDIIKLIQNQFNIEFDENEMNYNRLMTHLRYFVNNLLKGQGHSRGLEDDFLFQSIKNQYPEIVACVDQIERYVALKIKKQIFDEEKMYLMIHIQRVVAKEKIRGEKYEL
ncbi:MAG: PRD domain-containing protein [Erysipelotrichaceae bacterium]|nr:PRD domain-containing protein [Erysipelotrichaceae bacterium]